MGPVDIASLVINVFSSAMSSSFALSPVSEQIWYKKPFVLYQITLRRAKSVPQSSGIKTTT